MILSTIQAVVASLSKPCSFTYGDLFEANGELDIPALSEGKDIFFVYVPPLEVTDEDQDNGYIHSKFPLQFFMMKKLEEPTAEYKSSEVDPTIDEMRELAREFIARLENQDIVEKGGPANGIGARKYTSEYGWLDAHLFGVSCECEVPLSEGRTSCYSPYP